MRMQLIKFKCAKCGKTFKAPELCFGSYGAFLLRSIGNAEEAFLDAMEDSAYQEVNTLLKANPRLSGIKATKTAEILQKTFGLIACDPDHAGQSFQIGALPKCSFCGSQDMEYWEATEPPEFVEKDLPPVTHATWASLSRVEKEARVDSVLAQFENT